MSEAAKIANENTNQNLGLTGESRKIFTKEVAAFVRYEYEQHFRKKFENRYNFDHINYDSIKKDLLEKAKEEHNGRTEEDYVLEKLSESKPATRVVSILNDAGFKKKNGKIVDENENAPLNFQAARMLVLTNITVLHPANERAEVMKGFLEKFGARYVELGGDAAHLAEPVKKGRGVE